jgi:hypothetical protein
MDETALRRGNFELIMVWSDEGVKREIDAVSVGSPTACGL